MASGDRTYEGLLKQLGTSQVKNVAGLSDQKLVFVDSEATPKEAFHLLVSSKIQSVPVIDSASGDCQGIVDIRDFVSYVLSLLAVDASGAQVAPSAKLLSDFSSLNPLPEKFISLEDDLKDAMSMFGQGKVRFHRIPVVEKKGSKKVICMLSQMSLVQWVWDNRKETGDLLSTKLVDLNDLLIKPVAVIKSSATLTEAFQLIVEQAVTAVPVVKDDGTICGNISVSDVRHCVEENLELLKGTVEEFFAKSPSRGKSPVVHTKSDTFGQVVESLITNKIHRVWLVDKENKPCGVISLTDVLDATAAMCLVGLFKKFSLLS